MHTPARRAAPVASLAALALACASAQRAKLETEIAKSLISPEQSAQIGLQVQQQLQQQGVKYVSDPAITGWVTQVVDPILAIAKQERPDIKKWTVRVIDDPKTVNAFATGGGDMYVYTGLLLDAKDGAEVAGVLAHETGHVVLRHVERQMVDAFGLEGIAALALGKNPGALQQLVAGVAGKGLMLANSRDDESEADRYGVEHASKAGYDPHGLVRFFERLLQQQGKEPGIAKWLSDHPTTPDRIAAVNALIEQEHLGGASEGPGGIDQVQARIRALPPAPAPKPGA